MRNIGTYDAGVVGNNAPSNVRGISVKDSAIQSGMAYLVSELEKKEPKLREPLTSVTYHRDIPMKSGGGWVDLVTAMNIDYGMTGGSGNGGVVAGGANAQPVIQANLDKDTFKAHEFSVTMRIKIIDMMKENITGRSLDKMLKDGVRLAYDKHLDENTYIGMSRFGTHGLLNNPNVTATSVASGVAGSTNWKQKTADEILTDINTAITEVWENAGWDMRAIPNHIIVPFEQYNYIATTKVTELADKTILTFLLGNNICNQNGGQLVIGATAFCKGAGASSADRMAVYVHDENFLAEEELVPLSRLMTQPNPDAKSYDSIYSANVSEVEFFYNQTIGYYDGI